MNEICDGCGWKKNIIYVDEYGKGFCYDCMTDAPTDVGEQINKMEVATNGKI